MDTIEIIDYCTWVNGRSWADADRGESTIPFDMHDYRIVAQYGLMLQTYMDISCEMVPAGTLAETAELTRPLPAGTVVCVVADGYVTPLRSADEFRALMDEWREAC